MQSVKTLRLCRQPSVIFFALSCNSGNGSVILQNEWCNATFGFSISYLISFLASTMNLKTNYDKIVTGIKGDQDTANHCIQGRISKTTAFKNLQSDFSGVFGG